MLFDGLDFGLQILEILLQRSKALLARVEAAVEMSALLALARAAVSTPMVMSPLAATVVAVPASAIAIMTAVPFLTTVVVPVAVASAATIALAAFIALAAVVVTVMMSMSFIAAHRYFLLFFDGDGDRVATTDSYSARN